MNKKLIFSIAAAAALLVSTPGMNKAEAASPVEVQTKVYVHHAGQKLDQQQVNELIQKYMTNLKGNQYSNQNIQQLVNNLQKQLNEQVAQAEKQPAQKPVQQPTQKQEQVQKPVQQPKKQNNRLKNQLNSLYSKNQYKRRSLKQQHLLLLQ